MIFLRIIFIYLVMVFVAFGVFAAENSKNTQIILTSKQQERAEALYEIVRCPVCSGQSLAGSEASIAQDLRRIINQKIHNNATDKAIKNHLVMLYGEDILFEPPVNKGTWGLNYGVYVVLLIILSYFLYAHYYPYRKSSQGQGQNTNQSDSD